MLLIFIIILPLFLYEPVRRVLRPEWIVIIALVTMLVCLPIYAINYQEVSAYDEGDVIFRWRTWNFTIGPSDVERIDDVSNIHTKASAYIMISCDSNVTFYLIDQNRPESRHREANYSQESIGFRLPYLFTEAGVPARWSVCLMNPNLDFLNVSIESIWLEDNIEIARWSIEYDLYQPLVVLFSVWLALGTPLLIIHRKRITSWEFMTGVMLTIVGVGLGIVTANLVSLSMLVPSPLVVFLFVLLIIIVRERQRKVPEGPSVDIV